MDFPQLFWASVPVSVTVAIFAVDLIVRIIALGVIPHNRRPSAAWGWLLVVFFVPLLGVPAYLLLGASSLPGDRKRKQQNISKLVRDARPDAGVAPDASALSDWVRETVKLNQANGAMALIAGNSAEVLEDYNGSLDSMARAVRGAQFYVHFQFYIAAADDTTEPLVQALEEAHRRGVRVRVLIDQIGSVGYPGYKQLIHRLEDVGIPWRRMLPIRPWRLEYQRPDLRNHRKILVVDGSVAFTGSQNAIDASYNKKRNLREGLQWRDLMLELHGPVVQELNAVFITDWSSETGALLSGEAQSVLPDDPRGGLLCQVLPSGPGFDNQSNLKLFNHLFHSAQKRIVISSPYFIPEESMLYALSSAVQRGVEVNLHMGETADHALTHHAQRSYYEMLIQAGVRIFLYKEPYILHSKFVLIDEHVAVVASSNMDIRSFALNLEVNLLVCDQDFVSRMMAVAQRYRDSSHELDLESWIQRPLHQKYLDNVCRLTSALQ